MNKTNLQTHLEFLAEKPGYLKVSALTLALAVDKNNPDTETAKEALRLAKSLNKDKPLKNKRYCPEPYLKGNKNNVLIIGDLHEPFCLDEYLLFNRNIQEQFNCGTVIFIGDIIDNHYMSYHEVELSALGADDEFQYSKNRINEWYKTFPEAHVIIGNHDRLVLRKSKSSGISSHWIKSFSEALNTPNWKFTECLVYNDVIYTHGEGGTASRRMKCELQSVVQGHFHSEGYIQYATGSNKQIFSMQVGCGVDMTSYAMAYAKDSKKPFLGSGVVINSIPMLIPLIN